MAGSPCPIEVMKKTITKLHMPQVTVSIISINVLSINVICNVDLSELVEGCLRL